jgi:two-component system cell cycle response regulator DivK
MPKTVLLVDDDEDSRAICSTILRHHGYHVLEARDGGGGFQMALDVKPDVIVMDLNLPVLDGLAAMKQIKETPETSGIAVIVLTARASPADLAQGRDAGCDGYLTKPCPPVRVLEEVQRLVGLAEPVPGS